MNELLLEVQHIFGELNWSWSQFTDDEDFCLWGEQDDVLTISNTVRGGGLWQDATLPSNWDFTWVNT